MSDESSCEIDVDDAENRIEITIWNINHQDRRSAKRGIVASTVAAMSLMNSF